MSSVTPSNKEFKKGIDVQDLLMVVGYSRRTNKARVLVAALVLIEFKFKQTVYASLPIIFSIDSSCFFFLGAIIVSRL